MKLSAESVVKTAVNNQNNHHDLTIVLTPQMLSDIGLDSSVEVMATAHCCNCPRDGENFISIDPITVNGTEIEPTQRCYMYDEGEFPYEQATTDFLDEITQMLAAALP